MGIDAEKLVKSKALTLARRVAVFNSEAIFFYKNSLMKVTPTIFSFLNEQMEKFGIIIKSSYPGVDVDHVLAHVRDNENHDLLKLDVELLTELFLEAKKDESGD